MPGGALTQVSYNMDHTTLIDKAPGVPGRPMQLGSTTWKGKNQTDLFRIREESSIRFHLGYCMGCGLKVVAGYDYMGYLMDQMLKHHFPYKKSSRFSIKRKLAKILLDE